MRTAFEPHVRRALSLLLIGVLAASAVAQQVESLPQPAPTAQQAAPRTGQNPGAPISVQPGPQTAAPAPVAGARPATSGEQQGLATPSATSPPAADALPTQKAPSAPIIHNLGFPAPALHMLDVQSAVPTDGRASIELMMSMWTPGFYRMENYARDVQNFKAYTLEGQALTVEQPTPNRWRIDTQGEPVVVISYRLVCERGSVSRNVVNEDYAVICGGPTYTTLVGQLDRPHEVHLNLPPQWARSATGLPVSPDSYAHHYRAKDYDTLIDSPIAVGNLAMHEFRVDNVRHFLVDIASASDLTNWNGPKKAAELQKMVQETYNFWGFLPFKDYYFLNKIGSARGGGLEHMNSTLIHTSTPRPTERPDTRLNWLQFVAHEYFHAFNVKRLRPIELGPFDYENARRTSGLWVAEGLTNYFNSLIVARAGLCSPLDYLAEVSGHIRTLQRAPGRLVQSLAASSLETWTGDGFGGGRGRETSISYYTKGPVVGFLLDAKIRRATDNKQSLDDVMRLAYKRYAGDVGYMEQQFLDACSEVAGVDLKEFFDKALFSTEELDYSEALDWFGLRFRADEDESGPRWELEVLPDATDEQKMRMVAYLSSSKAPVLAESAPATQVQPVSAQRPAAAKPPAVAQQQPTAPRPATAQQQPATSQQPATAQQPAAVQPGPMQLVEGIGGIFLYSNDPALLAEWYEKNLGFQGTKMEADGAFVFAFKHRRQDDPNAVSETVWAILPSAEPRTSTPPQYSINYRVPDMARMLAHLQAGGVAIEKTEEHPYGKFAWIRDPDGNRVELFQKPDPPAQ